MRTAAIALALLSACNLHLNDPNELRIRLYVDPQLTIGNWIALHWWDPVGGFRQYLIERSAGSGPWVQVQPINQPGAAVAGYAAQLRFTADTPGGPLRYRVRVQGSHEVSNELAFQRDVLDPSIALRVLANGFALTVTAPDEQIDGMILERTIIDGNGVSGAPVQLAHGSDSTLSYVDNDLSAFTNSAQYVYSAMLTTAGLRSNAVTAPSPKAPALPPEILSIARTSQTGIDLTVRESKPQGLQVGVWGRNSDRIQESYAWQFAMPQSATQTTWKIGFVEPDVYQVRVQNEETAPAGTTVASSYGWVVLPPYLDPQTPAKASFVDISPSLLLARDGAGRFARLADVAGPAGVRRVLIPPGDDGSHALTVPSNYLPQTLVLDASGMPHALFVDRSVAGATFPVVHASYDGSSWSTEQLGAFAVHGEPDFELGADGSLVAGWVQEDGSIVIAHKAASGWTIAPAPQSNSAFNPFAVTVDDQGFPHIAVAGLHLWQAASGWSSEAVTPSSYGVGTEPFQIFAANGVVFVLRVVQYGTSAVAEATGKSPVAGWGVYSAVDLGDWATRNPRQCRTAFLPAGSRLLLVSGYQSEFSLTNPYWVLPWRGDSSSSDFPGAGFDSQGKFWLVRSLHDALPGDPLPLPANSLLYQAP